MMKKPRVLMLGWEFPPLISGGLGIACQGISRALAPLTQLTLILPQKRSGPDPAGIKIIGLESLDLEETLIKEELVHFMKKVRQEEISFDFSPYPRENVSNIRESEKQVKETKKIQSHRIRHVPNQLRDVDLYGKNVISNVKYYTELLDIIASRLDFDLVHAHDWMTYHAAIRLKERYKKPVVLHIHSLNFDRIGPLTEGWIFDLERTALHMADLLIPVSHYTGYILQEHYGVDPDKIFPVHNGVERVDTYRSEKKFPEKLVVFMGRITLQKGPEYFLDAATKVVRQYENVRFAIAGTGDKLKQLIEKSAYSELGSKIHFTGFIDRKRVHELFSMADVFCMPSLSEPFGLTALEAVQFGVPVVITKRAGAAEVLKSAFLADFWDTDLMANHIVRLLSDEKLHARAIRQGMKDISRLTWKASGDRILQAYNKVI